MDAPGDISDEFDDDALRSSIEKADQEGQWRDSATGFVDPKLETIKKQLAQPERASYTERRMRELQQQAAAKAAAEAAEAAAAAPAPFGDPFAGDWRETVVPPPPDETGQTPSGPMTVVPEPSYVVSPHSVHPVLTHLRPVATGLWVFAPIAVIQGLLAGWHYDLLLRALAASAIAGFAWQKFDVERFRAAVIGTAVHLLTFFVTASAWGSFDLMGNSVGFVIALVGSLVVGSMRESRKLLTDHAR
ncbi:MAG: hypothetical protein JNM25_16500 [Planctomycetes bacterium]|nr:hypothetical protein [Planctomycetota bacterium]